MSQNSTNNLSVAVLGAGLAGLAAAQKLRELDLSVDVYDKNRYIGGHAASHKLGDFTFDDGPHVSFTKRPDVKARLAESINGEYFEHHSRILNYWKGHWGRHPAQCNLYGLPSDVIENTILDFVEAQQHQSEIKNYAEWCYQSLGRTFSEEFTFRYTRKYWTTEASTMSVDWVKERMYPPSLRDVIRGAVSQHAEDHHYLSSFRYPKEGGFGSYLNTVDSDAELHLGQEVIGIDMKRNRLEFADGKEGIFERLVSSLPLPELVKMIKNVPAEVRDAAERLRCSSLVLVSVGVERDEGFPDAHWIYFYDEDIIFSRAHSPHLLSPNNVPKGCGSIQVEVYHSDTRPLPTSDVLNKTMEDFYRCGILLKEDSVLVAHEQPVQYANVIFDLEREKNLGVVLSYMDKMGILLCGRYGEWEYHWTDDSIVSGWDAAARVTLRY